jgi:hypothetical protein
VSPELGEPDKRWSLFVRHCVGLRWVRRGGLLKVSLRVSATNSLGPRPSAAGGSVRGCRLVVIWWGSWGWGWISRGDAETQRGASVLGVVRLGWPGCVGFICIGMVRRWDPARSFAHREHRVGGTRKTSSRAGKRRAVVEASDEPRVTLSVSEESKKMVGGRGHDYVYDPSLTLRMTRVVRCCRLPRAHAAEGRGLMNVRMLLISTTPRVRLSIVFPLSGLPLG